MAVWIFGIHSSDPFGSAMLLAGLFWGLGGLGRWSLVRVHPFGGGEAFAIPLVFPSV
jgi:hypothetical protein